MTLLGLTGEQPSGEVRIGFRSGWVRMVALSLGSASGIGLAVAAFDLAHENPAEVFGMLRQQGLYWLLGLVAMYFGWDLLKSGVAHLGKLSDSVQESAVAMSRIADKDDRERDRMITETAFIGQRLERMAQEARDERAEQRAHNARMEALIQSISKDREG